MHIYSRRDDASVYTDLRWVWINLWLVNQIVHMLLRFVTYLNFGKSQNLIFIKNA